MKHFFVLPFKDRDNKYQTALDNFIYPFCEYISKNITNSEIIIVEQDGGKDSNGEELFNLGRTINIGFDLLKNKMNPKDIFTFHPIDLLPVDTDYNVTNTTRLCSSSYSVNGMYYKAISFVVEDFVKVNGFANNMWGWGGEDVEMEKRLSINNVLVETKINSYISLCRNGNGTENKPHYEPYHKVHLKQARNLKSINDCMLNGLNTLAYKLINETEYKGVKKYIIR